MTRPERETVEALGSTKALSGTVSAFSAHQRRCDQVMSQQSLAPSLVVQHFVFHGHGLEIPTTLWERDSRTGHELRLDCLDPDGCVVRTQSKSSSRETGHISARWAAGTAFPAETRGGFSSPAWCVYLTGAFLWVRFKYHARVGEEVRSDV
jgi:hypothetical protein